MVISRHFCHLYQLIPQIGAIGSAFASRVAWDAGQRQVWWWAVDRIRWDDGHRWCETPRRPNEAELASLGDKGGDRIVVGDGILGEMPHEERDRDIERIDPCPRRHLEP